MVPRARLDAARPGARRHPRAGPLSRAGPGARPVLLGPRASARRRAWSTSTRSWRATSASARAARLPRTLGEAGRASAQRRADGRDGPRGIAPGAGMGALHRRGDPAGQRQGGAGRLHALGQPRAAEGGVRRQHRGAGATSCSSPRTRARSPPMPASSAAATSRKPTPSSKAAACRRSTGRFRLRPARVAAMSCCAAFFASSRSLHAAAKRRIRRSRTRRRPRPRLRRSATPSACGSRPRPGRSSWRSTSPRADHRREFRALCR